MSRERPVGLYLFGLLGLVAAVGGVALVSQFRAPRRPRSRRSIARRSWPAAGRVQVAPAVLSPGERTVELQGEARPYASVTLYAKVSGYLKDVKVDKGESRAPRGRSGGHHRVARESTASTTRRPPTRAYKTRQTPIEPSRAWPSRAWSRRKKRTCRWAGAGWRRATVQAIGTQKAYEVLRAPFSGTVTARFADSGIAGAERGQCADRRACRW